MGRQGCSCLLIFVFITTVATIGLIFYFHAVKNRSAEEWIGVYVFLCLLPIFWGVAILLEQDRQTYEKVSRELDSGNIDPSGVSPWFTINRILPIHDDGNIFRIETTGGDQVRLISGFTAGFAISGIFGGLLCGLYFMSESGKRMIEANPTAGLGIVIGLIVIGAMIGIIQYKTRRWIEIDRFERKVRLISKTPWWIVIRETPFHECKVVVRPSRSFELLEDPDRIAIGIAIKEKEEWIIDECGEWLPEIPEVRRALAARIAYLIEDHEFTRGS